MARRNNTTFLLAGVRNSKSGLDLGLWDTNQQKPTETRVPAEAKVSRRGRRRGQSGEKGLAPVTRSHRKAGEEDILDPTRRQGAVSRVRRKPEEERKGETSSSQESLVLVSPNSLASRGVEQMLMAIVDGIY